MTAPISHAIQALQPDLNSTEDPGLNGTSLGASVTSMAQAQISPADLLGTGSTQATTNSANLGKDYAFWSSLNENVENLHAVFSGHGQSSQPAAGSQHT